MSLLIKALEAAEKDKLSEKSQKKTGEYVVDDALSLESLPVEMSVEDELAKFEAETISPAYEDDDFDFVLASNDLAGHELSLAEEAGLTSSSNYVKPARDLASGDKEAIDAPNNKPSYNVDASVASKLSSPSSATQAIETKQKAAAKVFVANQSAKAPTSKSSLALLGVLGVLMVWLGLQGYSYIQSATTPDVVVVKPILPPPQRLASVAEPKVELQAVQAEPSSEVVINDSQAKNSQDLSDQAVAGQEAVKSSSANPKSAKQEDVAKNDSVKKESVVELAHEPKLEVSNNSVIESVAPNKIQSKKIKDNGDVFVSNRVVSQKSQPVRLVSKSPSSGVDPTLLAAYQAFTRGEDSLAQQQYRQVLQHDVRNVDALLGMAMIAQRQKRDADAIGWYQKVLEIEPRNSIAQTAIASSQNGVDAVGTESRIKNMLAQQPDSANLHAALGNLYAEQSQWASAQEAYFNASRYAPNNADYAFNMAVSLDQLGKTSLALSQYQRALELLNKSGASSPDRATLEARILALQ